MNWTAIGAIGELIGALAVVITLIFLAVQLRHGSRSLDESNRLNRVGAVDRHNDTISRWRGRMMENEDLARIWLAATRDEALTELETFRMNNLFVDFTNTQRSNFVRAKAVGEDGLAELAALSVAVEIRNSKRMLEAWRLTVLHCEESRMVAAALYKSLYEISYHVGIDYVLVVARKPVDRLYKSMQFIEALNGQKLALKNTLNLPHGLFYLPVREADALWQLAQCPLYPFMALTRHPDIEIDLEEVHRRFHQLTQLNGGEALPTI